MEVYYHTDSTVQCAYCGSFLIPIRKLRKQNKAGAFINYYKCEFPDCKQENKLFEVTPKVTESVENL